MKSLHRGKAIEAYKGARVMEEMGLTYPTYVLLKESLRATLAYIGEDLHNMDYSEKTRLRTLITDTPVKLTDDYDMRDFEILLEMEVKGLQSIMETEVEVLKPTRKALKKVIAMYMNERL